MNTKNKLFRAVTMFNAKKFAKLGAPFLALGAVTVAAERPAMAQAQGRFGEARQLAITAENLFGLSTRTVTVHDQPPAPFPDEWDTTTRFGLLFGSHEGGAVPEGLRVGAHYFIIPSLSLGGTLGFEVRDGSRSVRVPPGQGGGTLSQSKQSDTSFIFMPKVGYALMLNDVLGFWFRGGLGYASDTNHPGPTSAHTSLSFWLVSADALFVVAPLPHFGFYVGPTAELSFTGSYDVTDDAGVTLGYGASYRRFAIDTGLIGYFGL